ncbi:MAG: hypothetical protein WCJ71_03245, partial [Candidatus Omnitrophota bacterium]
METKKHQIQGRKFASLRAVALMPGQFCSFFSSKVIGTAPISKNRKWISVGIAVIFAWSMICPIGFAETINLEGGSVDVNTQDTTTNWNVSGNPVWNVPEFNV